MSRPSFCASCIDGPSEILADLDDRSVWICKRCYDGADHSLPTTIDGLETVLRDQRVRDFLRRRPDATRRDLGEFLGIIDDWQSSSAGTQQASRLRKRLAS